MEVNLSFFSAPVGRAKTQPPPAEISASLASQDGWLKSEAGGAAAWSPNHVMLRSATAQSTKEAQAPAEVEAFRPILNAVKISPEKRATKVPLEVLERAQKFLDKGDRGAAYLTLYEELGNEQILIQAAITTYTGFWGSGALTGNHLAMQGGGDRYNTQLDEFSVEIAQATLDAVRQDLENGGTGRLTDDQFQTADRKVWKDKAMPELFPGNVQFMDFWNHDGDGGEAFFSRSTVNMIGAGIRAMVPNTSFLGLNEDGRNLSSLVGKRPAEFANDPNYTIHGGDEDRFLTVVAKDTGFVEAFWDKRPRIAGGLVPLRQLSNKAIEKDSPEYRQRKKLYEELGANRHRPA